MIEKLDIKNGGVEDLLNCIKKINEVIDTANAIQKEREAERFEIQEWIGILEAVRQSVNVHEKQIDELQMKAEPEKCETPVDSYAEQRKWVGCLVRYKICNWEGGWRTDVLDDIVDHPIYPFKMRNGDTAQVCELVTANEIYPNKARTW